MQALKTLVLGGYGNFGARIARALAQDAAVQIVVGGRDAERAQRFARELGGSAQALQIDAEHASFASTLRAQGIGLVIHTAGPFQAQGYAVARDCAQAPGGADGCSARNAWHPGITGSRPCSTAGAARWVAWSCASVASMGEDKPLKGRGT